MTSTDEELAELAKQGSHEAFTALVAGHEKRMYGLALHMLRNPDDAADAAQETFVRCYSGLQSYNPQHSFGAWLYRIAYNYCLDVLRRRKRAPIAHGAPEKIEYVLEHAADPAPPVEEAAELNLSLEKLSLALEHVTSDVRNILTLRYTVGLSYGEIAEVLDIRESTVTMRLHHAKQALRTQMASDQEQSHASS